MTINFETIINGKLIILHQEFFRLFCQRFFFVFANTFVFLNALIFLVKKSDYANVLNQPFGAFARAV